MRLTVSTAILHLFDSSYGKTDYLKQRIQGGGETKISHQLYMNDLKLIAKSEEELRKQVQEVKNFSDGIYMECGLEKGAKISFKKGKLIHSQNLEIMLTEKYKS